MAFVAELFCVCLNCVFYLLFVVDFTLLLVLGLWFGFRVLYFWCYFAGFGSWFKCFLGAWSFAFVGLL